MTKHPLW